MKQLFFFVVCAAFVACNITDSKPANKGNEAHEKEARKALTDSANYTTIQWLDPETQDLGTIKQGQVAELTWKFKNTGNKPLIVADAHGGCGCTVAEKPTEPVAPGAVGVIKAKFNSGNFSGHVTKDVYVEANNSNRNNNTDNKLSFTADIKE